MKKENIIAKGRGALLLIRVGIHMGQDKNDNDKAALLLKKELELPALLRKVRVKEESEFV